ncbi:MAG: hypothetical protein PHF00_08665 [Elusimicrobia bacterium]|nr:hypothetical protein [Elusimicrobiota bacterium]
MVRNSFPCIVAACLLCGVGCAGPPRRASARPEPAAAPFGEAVCAGLDNSYACAQAVEKARLPQFAGVAWRKGAVLRIKTSSGTVVLADSGDPGSEERLAYSFLRLLPRIGQYLVHVQGFEGDARMLIDAASGARTQLDAEPAVSPDGSRLATASLDLDAQYNPNRVQVFKRRGGLWEVEHSVEPGDWGPWRPPVWLDDKTIRVERCRRPCLGPEHRAEPAELRLAAEGWSLVSP